MTAPTAPSPVMPSAPAARAARAAKPTREDFLALLRIPTANLTPQKVDRILQARLIGLDHGKVCERCGGTGHYSYNAINGTTCFGCAGGGHVAQKLTADLYTRVAADVAAGKLEAYLVVVRARAEAAKAAKTAGDRVLKAWSAVVKKFPYDWQLAAQKQQPHRDLADEINQPMSNAYKTVATLSSELYALPYARRHCKTADESKALDDKIEATRVQLLAATEEAMQVIAAAEAHGPAVLARHGLGPTVAIGTPSAPAAPAAPAVPTRAARDDSPSP